MWSVFVVFQDSDEEGSNAIEESDTTEESFDTFPDEENLISVHIRPHVGNRSDYPFCITPQQLVSRWDKSCFLFTFRHCKFFLWCILR